jgi:hypothetical protein
LATFTGLHENLKGESTGVYFINVGLRWCPILTHGRSFAVRVVLYLDEAICMGLTKILAASYPYHQNPSNFGI